MSLAIDTMDANPRSLTFRAENPAISAKAELSVPELVALLGALNTLIDIASALGARPGLSEGNGVLNAAGSEFDDITDIIVERYSEVLDRLRDAVPRTAREGEARSCELLRYDLTCDQDVTDVALAAVRRRFGRRA